jgi:hypothetical protein
MLSVTQTKCRKNRATVNNQLEYILKEAVVAQIQLQSRILLEYWVKPLVRIRLQLRFRQGMSRIQTRNKSNAYFGKPSEGWMAEILS